MNLYTMENKSLAVIAIVFALALAISGVYALEAQAPTFWETLTSLFSPNTFTIVGQDWLASQNPDREIEVSPGASFSGVASTYCSSGHALFDVFVNNYVPRWENKDFTSFVCGASNSRCIVQVYCVPHADCSSDSDCASWKGAGSKCTTKTATDPYMPLRDSNGNLISSYKICTAPCTGTAKHCWRIGSGNTCEEAIYNCDYITYPNCPSTFSYTSLSSCQSAISGGATQPTCVSNGLCTAANTCVGQSCMTNCGLTILGTKEDCGGTSGGTGTTTPSSCTASCAGKCGGADDGCGGTCDAACSLDNERELSGLVTILDVNLVNADGSKISEEGLIPGSSVKVNFRVKADVPIFYNPYLVEAGIIPTTTATQWGMSTSGFNAILDFFSIGEQQKDACCLGQENIADNRYEFSTWVASEEIKEFSYTLKVPDTETKDLCGSEKYWDGTNPDYTLYVIVKNGCYKDGFRKSVWTSRPILLSTNESSTAGGKCISDGDCDTGEKCVDKEGDGIFNRQKYCTGTANVPGTASLVDLKKVSLTKEEIGKATNTQLLASVCKENKECLEKANYTVSCISLRSLREEGTLTDVKINSFFDESKATIKAGGIGVGAGLILCSIAATPFLTTGPGIIVAIGACSAGLGVLTGITMKDIFLKTDDTLLKAINAKDANSVGICTAEAKGFDFNNFIESIGKKIKITGNPNIDGLIIIIGGILLFAFVFSMLKSK